MPLEKEYSIAADSTVSSPPRPPVDAPIENKRVIRTYGRPREEPQGGDADSSGLYTTKFSLARDSVHKTAPPGLLDVIPPSSPCARPDGGQLVEDGDDNESSTAGSPKFNFGWKAKLRALDDDDEDDVGDHEQKMSVVSERDDAPSGSAFGQPLLLQATADTLSSPSTPAERKSLSLLTSVIDSSFNADPFSVPATTPGDSSPHRSFTLSSPSAPRPLVSRGRIRKAILQDSDSEHEPPKDSSSTAASGSSRRKSRSPSTQPTSEDEMTLQNRNKSQSAGKKKSTQPPRSSVPPLLFTEDPAGEIKKGSDEKKRKKKGPTNKEKVEMVKERTRLAAQVPVAIPRTETTSKYSKDSLFARISAKNQSNQHASTSTLPTSDPIASFSSPMPISMQNEIPHSHSVRRSKPSIIHRSPSPAHHDSGEDSDLPDIGQVLVADLQGDAKRKNLLLLKQRALEQQKRTIVPDEDDDDLQIMQSPKVVVKEEESHRRAIHKRPSEGRKRQMHLAQINPSKQAAKHESPIRRRDNGESCLSVLHHAGPIEPKKLNQILAAEVQRNAKQEMERKAAEWQKYGGRTGSNSESIAAPGLTSILQTLAEKGLKAAENSPELVEMDMDEGEDESDEDWDPALRGSASPEPAEEENDDQEEGDENMPPNTETSIGDEFDEGLHVRPTRRLVVNSDSEDEDNKENDNELIYDHSEDKENTAVVRHNHPRGAPLSLCSSEEPTSPSLLSVRALGSRSRETDLDDDLPTSRRRPLKELVSDESPESTQVLSTNLTQSFTAKLQQASPLPNTRSPDPILNPLFNENSGSGKLGGGFSQFSQGEGDIFGPVLSLQPGFSDLFESTESSTNISNETNLHRTDTLDLTQDVVVVNQLQPAFQASDNLLRKADAIFEKEQEFVVEDAQRKEHKEKKPQLYVNDHGFLTQTRPTDGSPEIYRAPSYSLTQGSSRAPLRTLSMTSSYPESPTQPSPRRRLRRLSHTPPLTENRDYSPEPPLRRFNAFDVLKGGAERQKKHDNIKTRPDLAAYLENEAAESDDEDAFGFAKPKDADDEETAEDLDATLEELMDDKEMDENTIAPDLVHAKFMEQLEAEDQENEKFHQGVIQGEQRLKRRRGVEVDDSDEESDDDNNERARRAMKKLRKSDRGDIKSLEENEATRAFAEAYNQTLKDDDTEFLYLERETAIDDIDGSRMQMDEEDEEEIEYEEPETISHDEIVRQIRLNKEEGIEEDSGVDPGDVSWLDQDEEEETPRVKTVNSRVRPRARLQGTSEQSELDGMGAAFRKPANPSTSNSSKQWYAQEHKSRNAGTSRSVGGSAITGHAKAKPKTGTSTVRAGSIAKRAGASSSSTSTGSRSVKAAPSMLSAAISDKSRHFA
ncbi:hypothetical protein JR316_0005045 [Psilocybe cubensis]|uniref:DNA replication checkpoint mediator MRC1 domain-containing protein n=2 Tax=Psilocybe cubensis TaxID=181762 RepID=A0A8H7Y1M8_PSICU|nr:hypothetical protein JR316_0005045 [Psilocybe cubensis]KAH9482945.1 hypothetical protein JR316_0005045 [Psilocybe cubensis]